MDREDSHSISEVLATGVEPIFVGTNNIVFVTLTCDRVGLASDKRSIEPKRAVVSRLALTPAAAEELLKRLNDIVAMIRTVNTPVDRDKPN